MKFEPLFPADYGRLAPYFQGQRYPLSPYCPGSVLCWNNHLYAPSAAVEDDCLIIGYEFAKKPEDRHLIMPLRPGKGFSPGELADLTRRSGFDTVGLVPEGCLTQGVEDLFTARELEGYADYVYRTKDLVSLAGSRYSGKRNLIKQFERDHAGHTEPMSRANSRECLDFLDEWCRERDCDKDQEEELACEKTAATNGINHIETLGLSGLLVRVDGKVSAFAVASRLTQDTGVLLFEKAFARLKGLYQYLDRLCAERLFAGYEFINKECDMGIPGLAQAKRSYHPAFRVRSYALTLRK
ncbi:MAG: phosphatidylglycerol lysyltransferase domain-containing protein [Elusimicrobiota bacterium]